jgi:hypothetical protein
MDRLGRFRADTHERLTQLRFPIGSGWGSLLKKGRSNERREIGPIDRPTTPGCHAPRGNGCSSDDDLRPNCLHRPSQAVEAQNNGPIDFSGTLVTQCQTDRKGPALADRWRSGRGCGSGRRTAANLSYQGATGQSAAISVPGLARRLQPFRYLHVCSDCFRLERIAGWASPPLESAPFSRRTPNPAVPPVTGRPSQTPKPTFSRALRGQAPQKCRSSCSAPLPGTKLPAV